MTSSSQTAGLDARFSHILQPIRNLTKNWDVDIANLLDSYLDDLEHIVITFNCGETVMNFAEAALVIQGSACVYSKKVEYLYSLVYQVVGIIANKKKQQKPSSVDAEGNDEDAEFPEEEKEEFLSLDDNKEAKEEKVTTRADQDKESVVHPMTPMSLMAQGEGEKEDGEINCHKGEVLGNMSDFQMNCGSVPSKGGIFMDSNLPLLQSRLRLLACSTPYPHHERNHLEKSDNAESNQIDMPPPPPLADLSSGMDGGDDGGFQPMEAAPDDSHQAPQEEESLLPRRSERKRVQFAVQKPKPVIDHWALCDPYTNGKLTEKKLKAGKTFVVPAGTEQAGTKKRKRKTPAKKVPVQPISEFVQTRLYSHRPKFPKNPSLVPTFPEFDDLFWKEFKRRQELKRQKQKQQALQDVYEPVDDGVEEAEENNWPADAEDGGDNVEADDDDPFEPPQLQLEDTPIQAHGGEFLNSLGSSGGNGSYEDIVRQHVENFLAQAAKFAQLSELPKRVAEWEDKITPRLLEEEQREPFDIHAYGTRVIDGMQRNERIPFRRIVCGKPIFQICRIFLATLQLANTYNVEVSCTGKLDEAMDTMELRLLSVKRHYEELAQYQVPSAAAH
ncbi:condensin-2 complex subunit H2-like [Littorina saxatilis]|uniref:Condensin-2 complex subunit H2 n=1 Tax=Littorina saxatilis TaxID=31220 RepID=A0AAN9B5C3_9CAEN